MRIVMTGIEEPILVDQEKISVLEIENKTWFTRVCQSLISKEFEDSIEPYSMWDERGKELAASSYEIVASPFDLPWKCKELTTGLLNKINSMVIEDVALRDSLESSANSILNDVYSISYQLSSDYEFGVEWDLKKFLKTFGFEIDSDPQKPLLENLIVFLNALSDVQFDKLLVFINLKNYLEQPELYSFYESALFSKNRILLLESHHDSRICPKERKMHIDQQFLLS